jgi:hypothetical protein
MFGFFKKYDAHLCSAVSGRILDNGKPVVGVKVEGELYYVDEKTREDSDLTDENGCFTLPEVNVRSKAPGWLLCEQRTKQNIGIELHNKYYNLWSAALPIAEPVPEYDKKLSHLHADLSNLLVTFTFKNENNTQAPYIASSICRWNDDFTILE